MLTADPLSDLAAGEQASEGRDLGYGGAVQRGSGRGRGRAGTGGAPSPATAGELWKHFPTASRASERPVRPQRRDLSQYSRHSVMRPVSSSVIQIT